MTTPETVPVQSLRPGDVIGLPGYSNAPIVIFRVWHVEQQSEHAVGANGIRMFHLHCTDDEGVPFNAWRAPHEPVLRFTTAPPEVLTEPAHEVEIRRLKNLIADAVRELRGQADEPMDPALLANKLAGSIGRR